MEIDRYRVSATPVYTLLTPTDRAWCHWHLACYLLSVSSVHVLYATTHCCCSIPSKKSRIFLDTHIFYKKLRNVSCEYHRWNGWNSTLQSTWYIRHVRTICFLWTKPTVWLLILSFTQIIFLDAAGVNRTIFHNFSVHWYYITLIKGRYYIKHDINVRHGKQNPRIGRWL